MDDFRKLRKDEIKVRVQQINDYFALLLLYKDARCDMNILDEHVGPMNWKREHSRDNHNCIVSIWDGAKGVWVSKEDTGTESNTEKAKGLASDSFKRACTNWGIGRELYDAPVIKIPISKVNVKTKKRNGKDIKVTYDEFRVAKITYNRFGMIDGLAIKNQNGNVVFMQHPKDIEHLTEEEECPEPQTLEEDIKDKASQHVQYVQTSFENSSDSDTIKDKEAVNMFEQKAKSVQENSNDDDDEGPGF